MRLTSMLRGLFVFSEIVASRCLISTEWAGVMIGFLQASVQAHPNGLEVTLVDYSVLKAVVFAAAIYGCCIAWMVPLPLERGLM